MLVFMLSVAIISVVMLSIVAPIKRFNNLVDFYTIAKDVIKLLLELVITKQLEYNKTFNGQILSSWNA
jgi:hypothetical protein